MIPERTCVGCRKRTPQIELLRFSVDRASGRIIPDPGRSRTGRGAYLHPQDSCLAAALKRRALQRALRTPKAEVDAPEPHSWAVLGASVAAYAKSGPKA